jgi:hypothetical protein
LTFFSCRATMRYYLPARVSLESDGTQHVDFEQGILMPALGSKKRETVDGIETHQDGHSQGYAEKLFFSGTGVSSDDISAVKWQARQNVINLFTEGKISLEQFDRQRVLDEIANILRSNKVDEAKRNFHRLGGADILKIGPKLRQLGLQ